MNKIPHCLQCNYINIIQIGKHKYYECYHYEIYNISKRILAKYIKNSPKWCPLRLNKI